ncbi:MAG: hypothetical protein Q9227_004809 [Pyrenula ochraceoflavens]
MAQRSSLPVVLYNQTLALLFFLCIVPSALSSPTNPLLPRASTPASHNQSSSDYGVGKSFTLNFYDRPFASLVDANNINIPKVLPPITTTPQTYNDYPHPTSDEYPDPTSCRNIVKPGGPGVGSIIQTPAIPLAEWRRMASCTSLALAQMYYKEDCGGDDGEWVQMEEIDPPFRTVPDENSGFSLTHQTEE